MTDVVTMRVLVFAILLCGYQDNPTDSGGSVKMEKKTFNLPPEVTVDAPSLAGLNESLVIIHKEEVLFFDTDGKESAKIKGLKSPQIVRSGKCLIIYSSDAVVFCKGNGEIIRRIDDLHSPMPLMSARDEIIGFYEVEYPSEKTKVSILDTDGKLKTQRELPPGSCIAVRAPEKESVLFVIQQQSVDMFNFAKIQIWYGDKLLREISEAGTAIQYLGSSRSGQMFFGLINKTARNVIAIGEDGKERWRHPIKGRVPKIYSEIGRSKSGSDVLLIGYEDEEVTDTRYRMLLIGEDGKVIRDMSSMSYGGSDLVPGTDYMTLRGKEKVYCVELSSGKTLWQKSPDDFLPQEKIIDFGWIQSNGSTYYWYYIYESKPETDKSVGESHVRMTSLETGKVVVNESIEGAKWDVCPYPEETLWMVSEKGKVVSIKVR